MHASVCARSVAQLPPFHLLPGPAVAAAPKGTVHGAEFQPVPLSVAIGARSTLPGAELAVDIRSARCPAVAAPPSPGSILHSRLLIVLCMLLHSIRPALLIRRSGCVLPLASGCADGIDQCPTLR